MIRVTVGANVNRKTVNCDENMSLRALLEQEGVDYTKGSMTLDGATLPAGALDKTFADFGVNGQPGHEKCFLLSIQKLDNAM